jgi:amidase
VTELHELTALEQAAEIARGRLSPVEVTEHYLGRIQRHGRELGAFTHVAGDAAVLAAREAERAVTDGISLPPLHGVPLAIKDLTATRDMPTTFGSLIYQDYRPPADDDVVTFLAAAGTVSLGKTNVPEFGLPCYTENRLGPPAVTPHDVGRLAGGSSGGAAAAVAGGLLPFAHGSDGGGSIRIPASVCGLVGIKPSRARVSGGPVGGDFLGLSVHGPLARTVADAAALLDAMAGVVVSEPYFPLPLPEGETFLAAAGRAPRRLVIGRTLDSPVTGVEVDDEVRRGYDRTADLLADLGHEVVDVPLDYPDGLTEAFVLCWAALAHATPVPPGTEDALMPLTRYLRDLAAERSAPELAVALTAVSVAARAIVRQMLSCDAILTPTVALPPRPVGYFTDPGPEADFARQARFTPWTPLANMTGQPAISLPLHWSAEGLPIGMQFLGRPGGEGILISLAAQLEQSRPWSDHRSETFRSR